VARKSSSPGKSPSKSTLLTSRINPYGKVQTEEEKVKKEIEEINYFEACISDAAFAMKK